MTRRFRDPGARERIVEAARTVVAAHGVNGASMRTIAAEAGVTTGFVTHYFDDKQALMVAVLEHTNTSALRRVTGAITEGSAPARLRAAVEAVLPLDPVRRREWQVWVACWVSTSPGEELAAGMTAGWRGLRALLAQLLEECVAEGALPAGVDVPYEAQRLVTMVAGIGLLAGVDSPGRVRTQAQRMLDDQLAALV